MSCLKIFLLRVLTVSVAALSAEAAEWPSFHGPERDNIAADTGLLQTWPEDGPELLWTASGIGHGYSSVSISAGRIFTAGMIDRQTYVTAMDMTGKKLWQKLNGQSWQASERQPWAISYAGSRGTPTVDGDTVYHLSEMGNLSAFDAENGRQQWHVDVLKAFNAERPKYGLSESVLVKDHAVFCCPGGADGYLVALDKETGRTLWTNTEIEDAVGYCSPVPARIDGVEQIICMSASRIFSFDPEKGELLWEYPFGNKRNNNATDVIVSDGLVYASSGYGGGSILLRPQRQEGGEFSVEQVWKSELLDNHHGGVLLPWISRPENRFGRLGAKGLWPVPAKGSTVSTRRGQ